MNYINPHEFYLETNGKIIDMDGTYGGQCWDLFAYFTQKYCGRTFSCISTGYVIDLWTHFEQCGLSSYFDKVTSDYQDGDWFIWKAPCYITRYSHIAMFRLDNKDGTNVILTQNPNGNPNYTHQMICNYDGLVGALRPKVNRPPANVIEPIMENKQQNQVHITCDNTMRCRRTPEVRDDNFIGFFKTGFYNVLEEKITDYHWCRVADNNWVACIDGYANYIPVEIKQETPQIPIEEENGTNALPNTEPNENKQENKEIEQLPNESKNTTQENTENEEKNVIISVICKIIEFIIKLLKGDR